MAKPHVKTAVQRAEMDKTIVQLRRAGMTYEEIAKQVGCAKSRAHDAVTRHLEQFKAETQEAVAEIQRLELSRIDRLWQTVYPKAIGSNLGAVDRCMKLMDQRAKILGLNAPTKIAPTDPTGTKEYQGGGLSALLAAGADDDPEKD